MRDNGNHDKQVLQKITIAHFPTVFKDWKLKKNTDLHVKILLLKC